MTAQEIAIQPESSLADTTVGDIMLNAGLLKGIGELASVMATSKVTIPKHLIGSQGDCYAVVLQAVQWRMNPFAVAQKTHVVHGTLGYEAQLVNAVITSMAPTKDRLNYDWFGDWDKILGKFKTVSGNKGDYQAPDWNLADEDGLGILVWATMKGEDKPRKLRLLLKQAQVRNSTLWASDPRQQLAYLAVKRWSRLYCPDVILGVYTPDELQEIPATEREVGPHADPAAPTTSRTQALKDQMKAEDEAPESAPESEEPVSEDPPLTFAAVADALHQSDSPESLQQAVAIMADFIGTDGNEQYKDELSELYRTRLAQLKAEADQDKQ